MSTEQQQTYATNYPKILGLRWNLQHLSGNSSNCQNTRNYSNNVLIRVWSLSKKDKSSILLRQKMDNRCNIYAENTRCLEMKKETLLKGCILKNTRIGPVLNIKVCYHDDQYSIEVQIPSLFEDNTFSWVRIMNCVDTYVTESALTKKEEDTALVNPIATARPRQKPTGTLTTRFYSCSWKRIDQYWNATITHDHKSYEVSKAMTPLLRHDQSVPRGSDGAIHYSDIIEEISVLRESKLFQSILVFSSNSRTFKR